MDSEIETPGHYPGKPCHPSPPWGRALSTPLTTMALIVILLVAAATPAAALGVRLGAQVIGSRTSLIGDLPNEGDWEGRGTGGGGIVAEVAFTPDVALSFQPAYSPVSSREVFKERDVVLGYIDYDLDYISLPLIVRVSGDPGGVRGFVTAGVEFDVLTGATAKTDSTSTDIGDGFNSTTIAALFGAGAMVPVSRHFLTFEIRYDQGLDDIVARDQSDTDTGIASPSVKFRRFQLIVGFLFSIGGE